MDNTIIPYQDATDSSSEENLDSSDSDDEHSHLLSNNICIHYNKFQTDTQFMNMEDPKEYLLQRNKLFTPEISKKIFTVKLNALSTSFSLQDDIKLPTKNIIGFIKQRWLNFKNSDQQQNLLCSKYSSNFFVYR